MLKRNTIRFIIILGTIAICGIIIVQVYWIRKAWNMNNRQFNETVNIALQRVAQKMSMITKTVMPYENPVNQLSSNYFIVNTNSEVDRQILEYYLKQQFDSLSIHTPFEYAIYDCDTEKMVYGDYVDISGKKSSIPEKEPVFLKTEKYTYYFGVYFPKKDAFIFSQMGVWVVFSFIMLFAIVFFGYSMFIILRQKRLSELQKDFINNMTHEFKTPISTIGISAGVLTSNDILQQPERLKNYAQIIKQQSERLNDQVEKVLQISKIEKRTFSLEKEKIDLHKTIAEVVDAAKVTIESLDGNVYFNLSAESCYVFGDKIHITNIIHNLIDNAIKYHDKPPQIWINTSCEGKKIKLSIKDSGIGIQEQYRKKIFNKFYRVPTGNIHNVKGFGLGLYYVKTVCDIHKWEIELKSNNRQGSEFILYIPSMS